MTTTTQDNQLEVSIGPLDRAEIPELAELATQVWIDSFATYMTEEDLQETLEKSRSVGYFTKAIKTSRISVAKIGGRIIGYVQFGPVTMPEVTTAGPADRELSKLYVQTGQQGHGIGRKLMETAMRDPEMMAAPNIYLQVWECNPRAASLYESYGFEPIGQTHFLLVDNTPSGNIIMVRRRTQPIV